MSTLRMHGVVRRPSLPLTAKDEEDLLRLRNSPSLLEALVRLAGHGSGELVAASSEGSLLHAIFEVGLNSLRAEAEQAGYAAIAADHEEQRQQREIARRRRPDWADEA